MIYNLPLPPTGINHAYHTNNGRWFKDHKLHDWEEESLYKLRGKIKPTEGQVQIDLTFYDKDKRRRDIDGRIKPVLDLFQKAGLYLDDNLIIDLIVHKRYDKDNPRIEVFVVK